MTPIITPGGEELVLLPRAEYDALVRARDAAPFADETVAEEAWAVRVHDEAQARLADGEEVALPESVWEAIEALGGASRIRILRDHRGLSQRELARKAGVAQPYLSFIERDQKPGSARALLRIAAALQVPFHVLVEDDDDRAAREAAEGVASAAEGVARAAFIDRLSR